MVNGKIETGDFVNLAGWFGDVWAEVIWASEDGTWFRYAQYAKYGWSRWLETEFIVKNVCRHVKGVDAGSIRASVIYRASSYDGGCGRAAQWPTPLTPESRFDRRVREVADDAVQIQRLYGDPIQPGRRDDREG